MELYENEEKEYEGNRVHVKKLIELFHEHCCKDQPNNNDNNNKNIASTTTSTLPTSNKEDKLHTFHCMSDRLTYKMVKEYQGKSSTLKNDMRSFVRVRSKRDVQNGKITYLDVPDQKDELLVTLIHLRNKAITSKVHEASRALPV